MTLLERLRVGPAHITELRRTYGRGVSAELSELHAQGVVAQERFYWWAGGLQLREEHESALRSLARCRTWVRAETIGTTAHVLGRLVRLGYAERKQYRQRYPGGYRVAHNEYKIK
jgi:hypothetical protein